MQVLLPQAPSDFSIDSLSFKRVAYSGGGGDGGATSKEVKDMQVEA